jgi:hypothetical protein
LNDLQKQHSTLQTQPKHKQIGITNMKRKIISKILLTLGLVFVLGSALTPMHGGTQPSSASVVGLPDQQFPVVTIHSVTASLNGGTAVVARGQIGTFVLSSTTQLPLATTFVNFKVSGTAVPGVDYTPLVSPALIGASGFGVITFKALPDPKASGQAQSVVVTLEPGPGYSLGKPSSAVMLIKP